MLTAICVEKCQTKIPYQHLKWAGLKEREKRFLSSAVGSQSIRSTAKTKSRCMPVFCWRNLFLSDTRFAPESIGFKISAKTTSTGTRTKCFSATLVGIWVMNRTLRISIVRSICSRIQLFTRVRWSIYSVSSLKIGLKLYYAYKCEWKF